MKLNHEEICEAWKLARPLIKKIITSQKHFYSRNLTDSLFLDILVMQGENTYEGMFKIFHELIKSGAYYLEEMDERFLDD